MKKVSKPQNTFANMPLCGAKAKSTGKPCRCGAMPNGRCHKHGGAKGSGRPTTSGKWTKQASQQRKIVNSLILDSKNLVEEQ